MGVHILIQACNMATLDIGMMYEFYKFIHFMYVYIYKSIQITKEYY